MIPLAWKWLLLLIDQVAAGQGGLPQVVPNNPLQIDWNNFGTFRNPDGRCVRLPMFCHPLKREIGVETYHLNDCDGDGIPDPLCRGLQGEYMEFLSSAFSCLRIRRAHKQIDCRLGSHERIPLRLKSMMWTAWAMTLYWTKQVPEEMQNNDYGVFSHRTTNEIALIRGIRYLSCVKNDGTCRRWDGWCMGGTESERDCDGDGLPDPYCTDEWGFHTGYLSSNLGCISTFPFGGCEQNKSHTAKSELPARLKWRVSLHQDLVSPLLCMISPEVKEDMYDDFDRRWMRRMAVLLPGACSGVAALAVWLVLCFVGWCRSWSRPKAMARELVIVIWGSLVCFCALGAVIFDVTIWKILTVKADETTAKHMLFASSADEAFLRVDVVTIAGIFSGLAAIDLLLLPIGWAQGMVNPLATLQRILAVVLLTETLHFNWGVRYALLCTLSELPEIFLIADRLIEQARPHQLDQLAFLKGLEVILRFAAHWVPIVGSVRSLLKLPRHQLVAVFAASQRTCTAAFALHIIFSLLQPIMTLCSLMALVVIAQAEARSASTKKLS